MSTTLLTLSLLLASPSAGPLTHADFATDAEIDAARAVARASSITLDADDLVSTPESWRPLLSAALCEAQDRVRDTEAALAGGLTKPLARAALRASRDVESARLKLAVLDLQPMSCSAADVAPVVECLGQVAPARCDRDPGLAARTQAAERLMAVR